MKILAHKRLQSNKVSSFAVGTVYRAQLSYGDFFFLPETLQKNGRYGGKLVEITYSPTGRTKVKRPINKSAHPTTGGRIWEVAPLDEIPSTLT